MNKNTSIGTPTPVYLLPDTPVNPSNGRTKIHVHTAAFRSTRIRNGLSQKELSKKVGVVSSFISLIENGRQHPSPSTAKKIAQALDAPYETLFFYAN